MRKPNFAIIIANFDIFNSKIYQFYCQNLPFLSFLTIYALTKMSIFNIFILQNSQNLTFLTPKLTNFLTKFTIFNNLRLDKNVNFYHFYRTKMSNFNLFNTKIDKFFVKKWTIFNYLTFFFSQNSWIFFSKFCNFNCKICDFNCKICH